MGVAGNGTAVLIMSCCWSVGTGGSRGRGHVLPDARTFNTTQQPGATPPSCRMTISPQPALATKGG